MSGAYYIQDKRSVVGNCVLWWRKGGAGYTCDVGEAEMFTEAEAYATVQRAAPRDPKGLPILRQSKYKAWRKCDVDTATRKHVHIDTLWAAKEQRDARLVREHDDLKGCALGKNLIKYT